MYRLKHAVSAHRGREKAPTNLTSIRPARETAVCTLLTHLSAVRRDWTRRKPQETPMQHHLATQARRSRAHIEPAARPSRAQIEPAARPTRAQIERAALALLSRHSAGLLATARRYSASPEDAEDAYQRGVEILLTKAPTTAEAELLLPWLKTVVRNQLSYAAAPFT